MKIFTAVIILTMTALVTPLAAQWLQRQTPGIPRTADGKPNLTAPAPRTADGRPDITGLWQMLSPDGAVGKCLAPQTRGPSVRRHSALGASLGSAAR